MPRITSLLRHSWRHFSSPLAVLFALTIALALAGNVMATPTPPTPPVPGTVGPINSIVFRAQGQFTRACTGGCDRLRQCTWRDSNWGDAV